MQIKQINNESKGYFVATENDTETGKITYTWAGNQKMIIDHTEVNPEYKGKNVGKQLLMEVITYARNNHVKIIPLCPFAKSMFEKTIEIRDVLV